MQTALQIAVQLLISATTLLTMIQTHPTLPQSFKDSAITTANQAITYAKSQISSIQQPQSNQSNTQQSVTPIANPVFSGTINTSQTTPMDTPQDPLTCTLTADSNEGAPSSLIGVRWTSNAQTATIKNDRVAYDIPPDYHLDLDPPTEGYIQVKLSSEAGEVNKLTGTFFKDGEVKTCEVDVVTQ